MKRDYDQGIQKKWAGKGVLAEYPLAVFYDEQGALIHEFTKFMMHAAKPVHSVTPEATYRRIATAISSFVSHLAEHHLDYRVFDDDDFERYVEAEIQRVLVRQGESDEQSAKINVNFKIDVIYDFYEFAQDQGYVSEQIGPGCPIDTELSTAPAEKRTYSYRPIRISKIGKRSSINHFATDEEIGRLMDHLLEPARNGHLYKAERDIIYTTTLRYTAFRNASAASLTIDQFPSMEELLAMPFSRTVPLRPPRQKRGYKMTLEVSRAYALLMREFIDGPRARLLASLGIKEDKQDREVFLNSQTGKAMGADSLGDIISDGFRAIGVTTRRTGGHAIRRYRGDQWSEDIIRRKREVGGVVTAEVVQLELSKLLFHSAEQSNESYIRGRQKIDSETEAAYVQGMREKNTLRESELAAREARLDAKERELKELARELQKTGADQQLRTGVFSLDDEGGDF